MQAAGEPENCLVVDFLLIPPFRQSAAQKANPNLPRQPQPRHSFYFQSQTAPAGASARIPPVAPARTPTLQVPVRFLPTATGPHRTAAAAGRGVHARIGSIWLGWSFFDDANWTKFFFVTGWALNGFAMCKKHFKNVTAIHTFPLLVVAHRFLLVWLWLLLVVAKLERSDFTNPKAVPNFRK